jgi:hypothetical protein
MSCTKYIGERGLKLNLLKTGTTGGEWEMRIEETTANIIEDYRERIRDLKLQMDHLIPKSMEKKCNRCNLALKDEIEDLKAEINTLKVIPKRNRECHPFEDVDIQKEFNMMLSDLCDKISMGKVKNCSTCRKGSVSFFCEGHRNAMHPNAVNACWEAK